MSHEDIRLSAYLDEELPESEARELEQQLETDPELRRRYERLSGVSEALHADELPDFSASMEHTWRRLAPLSQERRPVPWWRRPIPVPLSGVAAALAVFVLFGVVLARFAGYSGQAEPGRAQTLGRSMELSVQVAESEQLLQRLSGKDAREEITIQLPESRTFEFVGQPVIVPSGR